MRITVFDSRLKQWRAFEVVPDDPSFRARCSADIHQFDIGMPKCACWKVSR